MAGQVFHKATRDRPMRHYEFPRPERATLAKLENERRAQRRAELRAGTDRQDWSRLYALVPALRRADQKGR